MDKLDYLIISELCKDARRSFMKIAEELGVTPYTVRKRYEKMRKKAVSSLIETKKSVPYDPNTLEEKIVTGRSILRTILTESNNYDLILIGASKEGLWKRVRFGTIPEQLTRKSPVSILVVRKHEGGILSWIRRFLAG